MVLNDTISRNHDSFIPGRQAIDNVVICQEIIHALRYTRVRRGGMAVNLDLEKAYDRMEWVFME